ncbi:MAG: hypothetical protein K0Q56_2125 [Sporolactobacillus laevolacticus]|jgi:hypothetical protein|nr:hypothetical protein [Sporolactobacillus laevolacticus]
MKRYGETCPNLLKFADFATGSLFIYTLFKYKIYKEKGINVISEFTNSSKNLKRYRDLTIGGNYGAKKSKRIAFGHICSCAT